MKDIVFPTKTHQEGFEKAVEFLKKKREVLAISLGGSVARGQGAYDSDLDVNFYVQNWGKVDGVKKEYEKFYSRHLRPLLKRKDVGGFFDITINERHLNPGPQPRHWTSGPDEFEVEVGNSFAYVILIDERNNTFSKAVKKFIPYYSESLRKKRLKEAVKYGLNNIAHLEPFARRKLYDQIYKRLYDARKEFLQALFISKRKYPLDYDKWVKYELEEILGMPEVYKKLVPLYELKKFESNEMVRKGENLKELFHTYIKNR